MQSANVSRARVMRVRVSPPSPRVPGIAPGARRRAAVRRAERRHAQAGALGRHGQGLHRPGNARRARQRGGEQAGREQLTQWSSVSTSSFRARDRGHPALRHHRRQRRPGHRRQQRRRHPGHLRQRWQRASAISWVRAPACLASPRPNISPAKARRRSSKAGSSSAARTTTRTCWPDYTPGDPTSGVVTHEFGHAINLAHSQTNGYYSRNQGIPEFGLPDGPRAGGPGPVWQGQSPDVSDGGPDRDDVPDDRSVPV